MSDLEKPAASGAGGLATLERLARILSLMAVPIAVALGGWMIQESQANRTTSQEYVKLAIDVLTEPNDKTTPALRAWAVDLLNDNSPTKFSHDALNELKTGRAELPKVRIYSEFNEHLNRDMSPAEALKARERNTRMWLGEKGRSLLDLKEQLRDLGYFKGQLDDAFGPDLVDAITAFQHTMKLVPEDGICGGDCLAALSRAIRGDGGGPQQ